MSGWLHKRGRHLKKNWNRRFFVAKGRTVRYYLKRATGADALERNSYVLHPGTTLSLAAPQPRLKE